MEELFGGFGGERAEWTLNKANPDEYITIITGGSPIIMSVKPLRLFFNYST